MQLLLFVVVRHNQLRKRPILSNAFGEGGGGILSVELFITAIRNKWLKRCAIIGLLCFDAPAQIRTAATYVTKVFFEKIEDEVRLRTYILALQAAADSISPPYPPWTLESYEPMGIMHKEQTIPLLPKNANNN